MRGVGEVGSRSNCVLRSSRAAFIRRRHRFARLTSRLASTRLAARGVETRRSVRALSSQTFAFLRLRSAISVRRCTRESSQRRPKLRVWRVRFFCRQIAARARHAPLLVFATPPPSRRPLICELRAAAACSGDDGGKLARARVDAVPYRSAISRRLMSKVEKRNSPLFRLIACKPTNRCAY